VAVVGEVEPRVVRLLKKIRSKNGQENEENVGYLE